MKSLYRSCLKTENHFSLLFNRHDCLGVISNKYSILSQVPDSQFIYLLCPSLFNSGCIVTKLHWKQRGSLPSLPTEIIFSPNFFLFHATRFEVRSLLEIKTSDPFEIIKFLIYHQWYTNYYSQSINAVQKLFMYPRTKDLLQRKIPSTKFPTQHLGTSAKPNTKKETQYYI